MDEKEKLIERYLSNNLTTSEQEDFENRMKSDAQFQADVRLHEELSEALAEKDVIALEGELSKIIQHKRAPENKLKIRRWIAIAAGILMIVTIGGLILYQNINGGLSPAELYQSHLTLPIDLQEDFALRASEEPIVDPGQQPFGNEFFELYRTGQYEIALEILEASIETNPDLLDRFPGAYYYFTGITFLQLDQPKVALIAFNQVNTGPYTENAEWYRALCLLKVNGDTTLTRSALEALAGKPHPQSKDAREILFKLLK